MLRRRALVLIVVGMVWALTVIPVGCVNDATPLPDACSKVCNETCVSGNDPASGCGGTDCSPCAVPPHQASACVAGACGTGACASGYLDCDPQAPGCETPIDANNCGKCGAKCGNANTTAVACTTATASDGGVPDAAVPDSGTSSTPTCQFTCSGAYAHCSADDSQGCETNIGTDTNNCGACGHSCGGGLCVGGYCQPVILAGNPTANTGLKSLYGITVLGSYVYGTDWNGTGPGFVYKVSTTPGNPLEWIVGSAVDGGTVNSTADFITTDGTSLTYSIYHVGGTMNAGIWNVHTDGSNNKLVVSGGSTGGGPACNLSTAYAYEVAGVAFDSSYIYWIRDTYGGCFPSTPSCQCQGVYRANADGTGVTQYFTSAWYTVPIADSGTLYMVDYFNAKVVVATSSTFTNNTPPTALPLAGTPTSLQTDANYVYWIDQGNKKFYRAKKIGATTSDDITPSTGMPGGTLVGTFLVDPNTNNLYFVSPNSSPNSAVTQQLYVMPKDGSGPAKAIPGAIISNYGDSLSAWTQDANAIYWTTYGFDSPPNPPPYSAVYKLAK